jgi:hypothetical protein
MLVGMRSLLYALAASACLSSASAQSPFPLSIPQRPSLPLPIPARPTNAGFLYLNLSSSYGGAPASPSNSVVSVPSALPPSIQGTIVEASVYIEPASSVAIGGWALTADGHVGSIAAQSSGAGTPSASSSPSPTMAPFTDVVAVAGPSISVFVAAIKSNGGVVAAQNSTPMDVPPESSGLRTISYNSYGALLYGLNAEGQFVAWSYSDTWPPRPTAPPYVATNWTMNKPPLVQAELGSSMYGDRLVGLTTDGLLRVWEQQGSEIATPDVGNLNVSLFRISPNSMSMYPSVAAIKSDGSVLVFRLGQLEVLPLPESLSSVVDVRFLPGYSDVLIALSADGNVIAWNANTGLELQLPEDVASVVQIANSGNITKADGTVLELRYTQSDPMLPSSGSISVAFTQPNLVASGRNYIISRDPSLLLGFPLSVLSRMVAEDILAHTNNYGLATKPDLLSAVQQSVSQTVSQVQADPNSYNLFSPQQYSDNYNSGVTVGTALVTQDPAAYNLYTSNSIMDLHMGGAMVPKSNGVASVSIQPTTTTNLMMPFTNNGAPITFEVPMPPDRAFMRVEAIPPTVQPPPTPAP